MKIKELYQINRPKFILVCFLAVVAALGTTYATYLMTPAFNAIKQNKLTIFLVLIVLSAVLTFINTCLTSLITIIYNRQVQNYFHQIRNKISKYIFAKDDEKVAEVQNNLNTNLSELKNKFTTPLLDLWEKILSVIFSVSVLFTFHWSLVLLIFTFSVIGLYLPKIFKKVTATATFRVTKKNEQLLDTVEKWARGLAELRRYASFGSYEGAIQKSTSALKTATINDCFWGNFATAVTSLVSLLGIILQLLLSVYLYFSGRIVFGAVITSGIFANQIMNAVTLLAESINQINSSKKLREKMLRLQTPVKFAKKTKTDENIAEIEVKDLSVSFANGEEISYPDFQIKKSEKVLLRGDSGTGKSTLLKLILKQLRPKTGEIIFKDKQGKNFEPNSEDIAYVAQDNTLFPDTIENNITMFDGKLNPQVGKVVKKVNLTADIDKFPAGLETKVDLDRGNLSGGQRQKVVLARAKIHSSQLLLIDEGTSAIDSKATKKIVQNLLHSQQTIIMIAHNFSADLVQMFDRQINLNNKEVS